MLDLFVYMQDLLGLDLSSGTPHTINVYVFLKACTKCPFEAIRVVYEPR